MQCKLRLNSAKNVRFQIDMYPLKASLLYDMVADPLFFTANGKNTVINRFGINFIQK